MKKENENIKSKKSAPNANKKISPRDTSDINPDFTDAFIREVDEDVKNDNFKELWKKYGAYIVAFVVIAVTAAVCFDRIKLWKIQQNQLKTENYMAAAQLKENPQETLAALQKISTDENNIFADFAKLQIANVLLTQEKNDEALATLQALADDKNADKAVRDVALIKLASYKVDTVSKAELEQLLQPILAEETSWTPLANDLLAIAAIKEGDIETAKEIYGKILKTKDLPEEFKTKIQDMLTSISDM